jgi:phosphomannomutase
MELSIFKAYDVRGIYPTELDEDAAYKIGRALVRFLSAKQIVVGRDMRLSSPALSEKLIEGITCEGADVIDIGECTTPMMNFGVAAYDYDGGVMVTASHNPGDYNGLKIISKKNGPLDETYGLPELKKMVTSGFGQCATTGTVTKKEILSDYVSHVLNSAQNISGLRVVCDFGNGMGAISAKPILARLDIDTIDLYEEPNGEFPNHPANPHDVVNFSDLSEKVISEKADLGVFFDGDADRSLFVDEKGQIVPIDLLTTLLAERELKANPGENVYYDLRFSKSVPVAVKKAGGVPKMLRVGNSFYKRALRDEGGVIGAEFAGHLMFPDNYNIDDGIFAVVKILNLLSAEKKPLSELVEGVRKFEASDEESHEAKNPDTVAERLISAFPSAKLVELDGTYLDFPDGFISVRQSQNEPQLFRIRVEAKTKNELEERLKKTREIVLG